MLEEEGAGPVSWLLDAPVSNSGRLAEIVRGVFRARRLEWTVEVVRDLDRLLADGDPVVATADRGVLDAARAWTNLARDVVERRVPGAWILDLEHASGGAMP